MDQEKEEVWKDIAGYEGYYQVSDRGRVRSLDRIVLYKKRKIKPGALRPTGGCIRKLATTRGGYTKTILYKNGRPKTYLVHRLVALAFIENPDNKPQVNHKDFNKLNCRADNLEWVTAKENTQYTHASGPKSPKRLAKNNPNMASVLTLEKVIKMRREYERCQRLGIKISFKELGKKFNCCAQSAHNVIRGKCWK